MNSEITDADAIGVVELRPTLHDHVRAKPGRLHFAADRSGELLQVEREDEVDRAVIHERIT